MTQGAERSSVLAAEVVERMVMDASAAPEDAGARGRNVFAEGAEERAAESVAGLAISKHRSSSERKGIHPSTGEGAGVLKEAQASGVIREGLEQTPPKPFVQEGGGTVLNLLVIPGRLRKEGIHRLVEGKGALLDSSVETGKNVRR